MSELKTRVEELKMENEYQLHLKEMNHSDKIKEMTDKSVQEIDALKAKHTVSHWLLHFGEYVRTYIRMCKHVCLYVRVCVGTMHCAILCCVLPLSMHTDVIARQCAGTP